MDVLDLLDSFETQVKEKGKEVTQKTEKVEKYGKWANYDLNGVLDERKQQKKQLFARGVWKNEKAFQIHGCTIEYSSNYVNAAWLRNCVDNFKKMQDYYFEKYYIKEFEWRPSILNYVGKVVRDFVNEEIRFIKTVLIELNIPFNDDELEQIYTQYIKLESVDKYLEKLSDEMVEKVEKTIQERLEKKEASAQSGLWVGGQGITGYLKAYLVGSVIQAGAAAASGMGDMFAMKGLKGELDQFMQEDVGSLVAVWLQQHSENIYDFLLIIFKNADIDFWFDVCSDGCWKQIMEYSKYEYAHALISEKVYWQRLRYLLAEYPLEPEIYYAVLEYDLPCMRELYKIAEFFGMEYFVLSRADTCIAKLYTEYADLSLDDMNEKVMISLWKQYQAGVFDTKDCAVCSQSMWSLHNLETSRDNLYRLLAAYQAYLLAKKTVRRKARYSVRDGEKLWDKIEGGDNVVEIDVENTLLQYYSEKAKASIDQENILQFEDSLNDLREHLHDEDSYKSDLASCLYAELLAKFYQSADPERAGAFREDTRLAADRGVVLARYLTAERCDDIDEREKRLLEIADSIYLAAGDLRKLYMEKKDGKFDYQTLKKYWKTIDEYISANKK